VSICLNSDELYELTHKKRPKAQIRALRDLGIDHKIRADGTPLVLRSAVEPVGDPKRQAANDNEPNWDAL
jgi:hypothetical protein